MKKLALVSLLSAAMVSCTTTSPKSLSKSDSQSLASAVASQTRTEKNKARDDFRNPQKTIEFFGITPDMTVVEIWPGGGWYAEILAPYLKEKGQYIGAGFDENSKISYFKKGSERFRKLVASRSADFGSTVKITNFEPPHTVEIAEPGSADAVLTFRNVHNWMARDGADAAFAAFFKALKPGGVLGVVEHRASTIKPQDPKSKNGYVREDYVIALAEKAGFKLAAQSEINANPKDIKEYPKGVWTLPPVLAMKDQDKAKYVAIGESDRMTLKFVKP